MFKKQIWRKGGAEEQGELSPPGAKSKNGGFHDALSKDGDNVCVLAYPSQAKGRFLLKESGLRFHYSLWGK